jgi:hypothetical protein
MARFIVDGPIAGATLQYAVDSPTQWQRHRRLMIAVLNGAIRDYQTYANASTGRGRHIFAEASAWFDAPEATPFAFGTICHAAGFDADFVRERLRRWYAERRCPAGGYGRLVLLRANVDDRG